MRASLVLLPLLILACDPNRHCRALAVGDSIDALPVSEAGSWPYAITYEAQTSDNFDTGPAFEHQCCGRMTLPGCDAASLQCDSEPFRGVVIYILKAPYSWQRDPRDRDNNQHCYVAVKDRKLVAIWSRRWS